MTFIGFWNRIAVNLLGLLGAQAPLDVLLLGLEDPDVEVCRTTIWTLREQLGTKVPLEVFVKALDDPDHQGRYCATGALGAFGECEPRNLLVQLATSSDQSLRWGAM